MGHGYYLQATVYKTDSIGGSFPLGGRQVDSALGVFLFVLDCMERDEVRHFGDYRLRLHVGEPALAGLWLESALTPCMRPEEIEERCVELWEKFLSPSLPSEVR